MYQALRTCCVPLILILAVAEPESVTLLDNPLRAAKCLVPNGLEHVARTVFLQQCISRNYAQGNETQCYDELGCFPMDFPWTSTLRPFPSPLHPAEIDVRIYCYTRDLPEERHNVTLWPDMSLNSCPFNSTKQTVFITHGFASNGNSSWLSDLKDGYLEQVDANVFLVDWGKGAELWNYLQVASNTRVAGAELARFLKYLRDHHSLEPNNTHLIGHSLGAHISSYAAKKTHDIGWLTALDPAQPGFEGQDSQVRLDKSDANFVDVIHTNAAPFIPTLGFGLILPSGHVDFYLNGGLRQPGCAIVDVPEIKSIEDLAKFPVEVVSKWVSCSHGRSYIYYTEVMNNNCTIWGQLASLPRRLLNAGTLGFVDPVVSKLQKCDIDTCLPLGLESVFFPARGSFAATTTITPPFCETNPDVSRRILLEIEHSANETSQIVPDILVESVNKGEDTAKSLVGNVKKGEDSAKSLVGKVGGVVGLG